MLGSLLRKTPINKNLPYKCKGNRLVLSCCKLVWPSMWKQNHRTPIPHVPLCKYTPEKGTGIFGGMKVKRRLSFSAPAPPQLQLNLWLRAELSNSQDALSSLLIHLQQLEQKVFMGG